MDGKGAMVSNRVCSHVRLFVLDRQNGMGMVYYLLEITPRQCRMKEGNKTITLPGGDGNVSWKGSEAGGSHEGCRERK